jgi:hypothetical protein
LAAVQTASPSATSSGPSASTRSASPNPLPMPSAPPPQLWDNASRLLCETQQMTPPEKSALITNVLTEAGNRGYEVVSVVPWNRPQTPPQYSNCVLIVVKRPRKP